MESSASAGRGRGARWGRRARGRARLGPEQHRLQTGTALGVAIVTTVAVSRSRHNLAAHTGAKPLAALTEGYQSAFLACAVLAGIGRSCSPADCGSQRTSCQSRTGGRCRCRRGRGDQVRNEMSERRTDSYHPRGLRRR